MKRANKWNIVLAICLICTMVIGSFGTLPVQASEKESVTQETIGTNYYMDSENGDDKNDGLSPETAWKSLEKIDQKEFKPGDKILFRQGTEYYGRFHPLGSGTKENPITIDIYEGDVIGEEAGERAAIHGEGKYTHVIFLENMSNWNIYNMEVTNKGENHNERRVGVNIEITEPGVQSGFHLDNLYVHDVTGTLDGKDQRNGGIYFTVNAAREDIEGTTTHFQDVLIENCYVKDVSRTAISMGWTVMDGALYGYNGEIPQDMVDKYYHKNVVVRNNYVERAGGDSIVVMETDKPLVEYNVAAFGSQNTAENPSAMYNAGIWPWRCEDAVFQYNEAFGTVLNGDGQAFDCDFSDRTTYQYNYSHDNEGGFMLVCQGESLNSVVRYNISQNDKRTLFMLSNPNEAVFYNNTFYMNSDDMNIDSGHGGKASMYNNIFYNAGGEKAVSWGKNSTYDNNLYYGFSNLPEDANKIVADPMFADPGKGGTGVLGNSAIDTLDGYQLQANSPAIDAGLAIENNGGRDYFGNKLTDGKTDIGAAEYVKAASEVDKTDLDALITYAKEQQKTEAYLHVVPVVKEKFEAALEEAEAVNADAEATQEAVDTAYDKLLNMVQHLAFTGNTDSLKVLVDVANGLNEEVYTSDTWKVFAEALKAAEKVLADANALQEEIDAARESLQTAMDQLVKNPVDKTKLQKLVENAKKYEDSLDEYTPATGEIFQAALDAAREVLDDEKAIQQQVDEAYANLLNSIFGLRMLPDKEELEDLIKDAETKYEAKLDEYTPATADAFKAALDAAREVLADENATQEQVDEACRNLRNAIFGLRLIPNKDKLEDLISKVENVDLSAYTAESAAAFQGALRTARAVMEDPEADQSEVNAAEKTLQAKFDGLVAAENEQDKDESKKPGVPTSNDDKNQGTDDGKKSAKTGDVAALIGWTVLGVLAVLASMAVFFERRRQK